MSKEKYLQLKKELKIRFMLNILIALIATVFYIQMVVNHSRYMVYVLISIGALSLMNQFLILPVYNAKKEAELEHPEWKTLPTKGVEIPQEETEYDRPFSSGSCSCWISFLLPSYLKNGYGIKSYRR